MAEDEDATTTGEREPLCRRCEDREQHLSALTRVHEKTADALRESQKLLRAVQPDVSGDKDWALLYREMLQSNQALQAHLTEANRSNRELRQQLDLNAELLARTSALKTENEILRGDTNEALQQVLSAIRTLQLPRASPPPPSQPVTSAAVKKKGR